MSVDELIQKYVQTNVLTNIEREYLRKKLTPAELEHLATRPQARGKLSKRLFQLSNYLFCRPGRSILKKSAVPVTTATAAVRSSVAKSGGHPVSGGGANGTGKAR